VTDLELGFKNISNSAIDPFKTGTLNAITGLITPIIETMINTKGKEGIPI